MSHNRIPRVDLRWTPQYKPKATWRRTVEKEIKAMSLTWGEAGMTAQDRIGWRQRVKASCSMPSSEKEEEMKKKVLADQKELPTF